MSADAVTDPDMMKLCDVAAVVLLMFGNKIPADEEIVCIVHTKADPAVREHFDRFAKVVIEDGIIIASLPTPKLTTALFDYRHADLLVPDGRIRMLLITSQGHRVVRVPLGGAVPPPDKDAN